MKALRLAGTLGLCLCVLLAMVISVRSSLNSLDQPTIEIVYLWSAAKSCTEVHALTPASWIPISEGLLRPGDCILSVAGESIDSPAMVAKLKPLVDLSLGLRMVPVRVQREGQASFIELVPAIKMTPYRILQIYFTLFITAIILWVLGLITFLADRRLEQNVTFAQVLWCIALCALGSTHRLPAMGQYFTLLTVLIPMPLVGALLFHLAWVFPVPTSRKLVKYSLYPLAFYSAWIHTQVIMHIGSGLPWVPVLARRAGLINGFLIFSGFVMLLGRWGYLIYRQSAQPHIKLQLKTLLMTWVAGFVIAATLLAYELVGHQWLGFGTSAFSGFFLTIIPATGTAFVMLRYGAFSYKRIWTLDVLMIILVSAVIVDIAFIIMVYQQVDGFVFLIAFLVAVLTSGFWYLDTGVRRVFERYFLRHQHDADILYGLIKCLNVTVPLESSMSQAIDYIALRLQLEWVAIRLEPRLIKTADHFYIMETKHLDLIRASPGYPAPADPSADRLSHPVSISVNYDEQGEDIGRLTLGRKISSEGFDKKDRQLIKQIAQYISWFVVVNNQIELINVIVDRILKARDNIFNDLNHLIHDEIMAKLHWVYQQIDLLCEFEPLPQSTQAHLRSIGAAADTAAAFLRSSIIRQQIAIPGVDEDFLTSMLALIHQLFSANGPALEWIGPDKESAATWQNLSLEHKRDIYRIIHSAITNALNHGSPGHVRVSFDSDPESLSVRVADDGTGFDTTQIGRKITSTGLMTMMERSRGIGGKLDIQSSPGHGAAITLSLPRMNLSASPTKPYVLQVPPAAVPGSVPPPPEATEPADDEDNPSRVTPLTDQAQAASSKVLARIAVLSALFGILLGGLGMLLFQSSKPPAADPPRPAIKGSLSVDEHRDRYGTPAYLDARGPDGPLGSEDILDLGDTLTVTFQVRNTSAYSLYAKILALGSHGPGGIAGNWSAPGVNFPASERIWIDSGKTYSMTTSQTFNTPGDYFIEPIFQDMYGGWHGIQPFPRIIFFVADRVSPVVTQTLLIHASQDWQYTEIYAQPGDIVSIEALNGQWTTDINSRPFIDAEGYPGEQPSWLPVANANLGQLVGAVGVWEFGVGQEETLAMPAYQGMIRLKINDASCADPCLRDNQGAILVSVTVRRQK